MTKADILAYSNTNIRVKTDPSSVSTDNVATSIDNCAENFANADLTADANRTHDFGGFGLELDNLSSAFFDALLDADGIYSEGSVFINSIIDYAAVELFTRHNTVEGQNDNIAKINMKSQGDATTPTIDFILSSNNGFTQTASMPFHTLSGDENRYIPLSVNGTFADSAGNIPLVDPADDFLNDGAAATGGIAVGGLYHTSGVVKIRLS